MKSMYVSKTRLISLSPHPSTS